MHAVNLTNSILKSELVDVYMFDPAKKMVGSETSFFRRLNEMQINYHFIGGIFSKIQNKICQNALN